MGALHDGHRSLVRQARRECDRVAVSIFVNPRQFGPSEDLDRYPRTPDADASLLAAEGVDLIFAPPPRAMYRPGASTTVSVSGPLATTLEGAERPGHFDGVATVVAKLLVAGRPHRVYLGQKDAQQCAVIRRLVADLDFGIDVVVCPTVRESDGVALSSRNAYLGDRERLAARALPRALAAATRLFDAGERATTVLADGALRVLAASPLLTVDYVAVVNPADFTPVAFAAVGSQIVVAAKMQTARLIDTVTLGVDPPPIV